MTNETERCHVCGGSMLPGATTYCDTARNEVIVFEHVPALICRQCGEEVFSSAVVGEIERIAAERPAPTRVISVDVYDLSGGRLQAGSSQEPTTARRSKE